jgi:hypothetical protein
VPSHRVQSESALLSSNVVVLTPTPYLHRCLKNQSNGCLWPRNFGENIGSLLVAGYLLFGEVHLLSSEGAR